MQFAVELYETSGGHGVVEEELEAVGRQSPALHALLVAGLNKLRRREYHRPPLCMPVEEGLFELRVGCTNIARAIWFFCRGRRVIVVRCCVKKTQRTPRAEIELARKRMHDYESRCGG
jgi:phage-related protein